MYTSLKNVQILIALLKAYEINQVILCPGGSDWIIIHSLETDSFFQCYSVVDESSAPFFAMGLCKENGRPVVIVCTSGTAASNFVYGMQKAYEGKIPIIAITADRDPFLLNQMETQKIDQDTIFENVTGYNITLPYVSEKRTFIYCERVINEALMVADEEKLPVHFNVPTVLGTNSCVIEKLPQVRKFQKVSLADNGDDIVEKLKQKKRILVLFGQSMGYSVEIDKLLDHFLNSFDSVIGKDHLSNLEYKKAISFYPILENISEKNFKDIVPDLLITCGNNFAGEKVKSLLRKFNGKFEHWEISPTGKIRDTYYALTTIIKCKTEEFFEYIKQEYDCVGIHNDTYRIAWENLIHKFRLRESPYCSFMVARYFAQCVPSNAVVHTAILNSTRLTQYFQYKTGVKVYSNVGALGIDGCTSTLIGLAEEGRPAFLLVGDLSFFYDITSTLYADLKSNIHICVINNYCGGEFHLTVSKESAPDVDDFIAAGHATSIKEWVVGNGYKYISASNQNELELNIDVFAQNHDKACFFEVFTDADIDASVTKSIRSTNNSEIRKLERAKQIRKNLLKILGEKRINRLMRIVRGIR